MDQPVQKFLLYFGKYYIGSVIGNRRRIPRFSIEMWNQFDQTLSEMPRANNSVEGWHRGFQFQFSKKIQQFGTCYEHFKATKLFLAR